MKSNWGKVESVYHAALARPASERTAFVRDACGEDGELRQEVESLLAQASAASDFLQGPAVGAAAKLMTEEHGTLIGRQIGVYRVTSLLGAGGMGEVYRARDTKLGRDVAVKVLPPMFTADRDRLSRFEREARLLATLNHPHIGAIYGLEEAGGMRALVLELVDGETLAEKLAQGSGLKAQGLPLNDALAIARQIADALDAAHEKGIIHRDLKPANIKITPEGTVKVLDFGLAKAATGDGSGSDLSQSPTITVGGTHEGMILGTAAYMSPEQARGKPVDKRTDIWAFGCVLYEMLTGKPPFPGETISDTIAAILERDPDWNALPAATPPNVRHVLERCLEKDPRRRLRDIGDIGLLLAQQPQIVPPRRIAWLWPAAAVLFLALVAVLAFLLFGEAPTPRQTLRFQIPPPGSVPAQMFTLSPDGRYLAFIASDDGPSKLWVRSMDALDSRAFAGTDGATYPFWSPDGQYLGFFAQGKLKKIAVAGGPLQTLCDAANGRGGSWNRDGVIVFSSGPFSQILRVSSAGGEPMPVTGLTANDGHRFPAFLPDGTHFLYNGSGGLFVGSLDRPAPVRLLPDATNGLYAPPTDPGGSGFLLFRRESRLMAQPFDPSGLRTTGEMFPVAEQVWLGSGSIGFGAFSVAANGTLVYRTDKSAASRELVWVSRTGKRLAAATEPAAITSAYSLAPDGKTLAVTINVGGDPNSAGNADIWLQDVERGVRTRFTFRAGANLAPIWSPDGSRVAFSFLATGATGQYSETIYQQSAAGSGKEEPLLQAGQAADGVRSTDWSPDGKFIVYQRIGPKTAADLWLLPLEGERQPVPYLQTPFNEQNAQFSPGSAGGSRWMAYQSNESGQNQIFIRAIPASGAKYQVSTTGGTLARWRQDGKELFYLTADQKLIATPITLGANLQIGTPQELFTNAGMTSFVPSRDGQRFLVNVPATGGAAAAAPITVVTNWQAALKK